MANVQQIVRDYLLRARSEGVAQVESDARRLGQATDSLAVKTENSTKSQVSVEKALERTALRMNTSYKLSSQLAQAEATLDRARSQGLQGTSAYQAAVDGLAEAQRRSAGAANDNHSAFDRLGNMLTRRLIFGVIASQAKQAVVSLINLNSELAKTGDIAQRTGVNAAALQGFSFAAAVKGVGNLPDAMLQFNRQVDLAKAGVGDLATLFRSNGLAVKDTEDAFLKVADLVKNTKEEAQKFSIAEQAGLPATREMVKFLEQGSAAIRERSKESRNFTNEQLRQAQEIEEKWNAMWASFTRAAKQAFLEVFNFFDKLSSATNKLLMVFSSAVPQNLLKSAFESERSGFGTVGGNRLTQSDANKFYDSVGGFPKPVNDNKTNDPARMKELLGLEQQRIGVLGQMATVEQQVRAVEIGIALARLNNVNITKGEEQALLALARAQAIGLTQIRAATDALKIEAATVGMSAGDAAAYRAVWEKVYEARRAGRPLNDQQIRDLQQEAVELGRRTQALENFKQVADLTSGALSGFAKDIGNGVAPITALATQAKRLAESVIDITAKKITTNLLGGMLGDTASMGAGATSAAGILTTAGTSVAAALVAGAAEAAAILGITVPTAAATLPIAGAATGTEVAVGGAVGGAALAAGGVTAGAAIWGPIAILAAAVAALGLMAMGGESAAEKEMKKNQEAWANMKDAMVEFTNAASQTVAAFRTMRKSAEDLWMAAIKAGDAASAALIAQEYVRRGIEIADKFANPKVGMSDQLKQITDLQDEASKFIAELNRMGFMWADQAAIMRGVQQQVDEIKRKISAGLEADINTANGKSFINDLNDLLARFSQLKSEASRAGVDTGLIDRWFKVNAQKIVDGTDLIGSSFNDLLAIFPDLTGVIHESAQAMQAQIDEQKRLAEEQKAFYDGLEKDINDFIRGVKFGNLSTLSPTQQFAAAQADFAKQSGLALGGDRDAQSTITKFAQTLLEQSRSFLGPSQAYGSIESQVMDALNRILGMRPAGMVAGGMIGNGVWNQDSVRASYAGGGNIMLAGGEFVNRATSVTPSTLPMLQYINKTGQAPANDNGAVVAEIRAMRSDYAKMLSVLVRLADSGNQIASQVVSEVKGLRTDTRQTVTEKTVRQKSTGTNG